MTAPYSLILVHGNGGGGFRFARALPYFSNTVNVVVPTLPGFAGEPRDPALTSVRAYAEVLHDIVVAQPSPRVVLGTGIGGTFVLELLQYAPESVDAAILHAPVGTRLDTRWFPRLMKLPLMRRAGQMAFASPLLRPMWRRLLFHTPLPDETAHQFFAEYRRCSVFSQMFDLITPEWFTSLQPVDTPTALLWGERERVLSVDQLDDYKALLNHHTITTVADWDHFPMLETPQAFADVVERIAAERLWG
jgi:pimeloyl-ACP methyl ester carboxylesterase